MPINYQFDTESKIVSAKATGTVSAGEILNYVNEVLADSRVPRDFAEIVDFEDIKDLTVSYSELEPFPNIWKRYRQKGCKQVLIYAPTDLSFGTFRMLQTFVSLYDDTANTDFIVCRTKKELDFRIKELCV